MGYKHDYVTAMNRLVSILKKLYDGEELSVKQLAEEFGVSAKTVQRDFNERLCGLPIEKSGRKWRMKPEHSLSKEGLTQQDKITLDLLHGVSGAMGSKLSSGAAKLLEKLRLSDAPPVYARLNMEDISSKVEEVSLLERAIAYHREVRCLYTVGSGTRKKEMVLRPLKLVCFEGYWYLLAIDTHDGHFKKLHLRSIDSLEVSNKSFTPDDALNRKLDNALSIWFEPERKPIEVVLLAQKPIAKYFKRKPLPGQRIVKELENGSMEISIWITHTMEVLPLVQYWIPYLQVIEPASIFEAVKNRLEGYLRGLSSAGS